MRDVFVYPCELEAIGGRAYAGFSRALNRVELASFGMCLETAMKNEAKDDSPGEVVRAALARFREKGGPDGFRVYVDADGITVP